MKNKFFTSEDVYKDRMSICRSCNYYFKLTGQCKVCKCFMKLKARIAPLECPKKYWTKTTAIETPEELPEDIINEILNIWEDIKTEKAKNPETKARMIEIYNTVYGTNYQTNTNCGSCISACFDGIKKLYYKYNQ
jgi:hypothetical protein